MRSIARARSVNVALVSGVELIDDVRQSPLVVLNEVKYIFQRMAVRLEYRRSRSIVGLAVHARMACTAVADSIGRAWNGSLAARHV